MLLNQQKKNVQATKQKNIVHGFQVIENQSTLSKMGMFQSKETSTWTNPCRHALTGRVTAAKVCINNYECNHCAYDQMIDDEDMAFLDNRLV